MMEFQLLESGHLRECADLFVSAFSNPPWNETWSHEIALKRLKDCHDTPGAYGIVAIADGKVLGFAIGHVEAWHEDKHFYLKEICVQCASQRSGIGKQIVDTLYHHLADQNVSMIYLLTLRDSVAEAFYEKCGFSSSPEMTLMLKTIETPL